MLNLKTPGVSVEEITRLPYSVALADTAIPAFIGYTDFATVGYNKLYKISSFLQYEEYFGKAKQESIQLKDVEGKGVTIVAPPVQFLMYYSLQMYFANGGGPCYIVSVGNYTSAEVKYTDLKTGLDKIENSNEPTLIVFPDAISLTNQEEFYTLYNEAIAQAERVKNRFVILDTYYGDSTTTSGDLNTIAYFRDKVTSSSYAAAYFPHLKTILNYTFDETETPITHIGLQNAGQTSADFYSGEIAALDELKRLASEEISSGSANGFVLADLLGQAVAIAEEINEAADETHGEIPDTKAVLTEAIEEAKIVLDAIYDGTIDDFIVPDDLDENAPVFSGEFDALKAAILNVKDKKGAADGITLKNLESSNSELYNQVKKEIRSLHIVLPPSSAMAGVYGRVDSVRGVWKAPANVSLNYVTAPTEKVSEEEQSDLNIHDTGKSINAIKNFTGKGILVWGARTLDGKDKNEEEDNEWKYVHVRRYYDMVEQSIKEALKQFIDQPNISYTWLRAKTMLENFLNQQWLDGALAGSIPKEAYHVEVDGNKDEPKTMDVTVKIALVRPAEFIVLNFSHQLQ
ncbi:phage tail sheath subtilisin-like domain-containing protein [Chryseobacterium sp. Y16C]|uniref:phage tail sheath family protein n=1 Tax=Chryseobacterium sp. Y16C TaxID=2920939 RepID=UPI001F0BCB72|nr:phage tail sheath C-terminal domain-containing protein [Chryseobacterium sp. Y16C]UMQ43447.1 phage tail sheath subtilisin-like domain-containing protein [Chryseobacterium sp. Y16C]